VLTAAHVALYRRTGGRLVGRYLHGTKILLLEHTGRRSGRTLTAPLVYAPVGDDLAVVASAGASDEHPQWFLNLRANPQAAIVVGRERREVIAYVASTQEKAELWPQLVAHNPDWGGYAERTTRDIPVVLLRAR
jgi:deazaflavin-dependent oxidoreductase (nitroreductase family)